MVELPKCACGRADVYPGEDECHLCLGRPRPIFDRPYDESRIGTPEWIREMKEAWPLIMGEE